MHLGYHEIIRLNRALGLCNKVRWQLITMIVPDRFYGVLLLFALSC
jgi:hypothetical protein